MLPWLSSSSTARSSALIFSSCSAVSSPLGRIGAVEDEQPKEQTPRRQSRMRDWILFESAIGDLSRFLSIGMKSTRSEPGAC